MRAPSGRFDRADAARAVSAGAAMPARQQNGFSARH
jgi:hypothetical protein